MTVTYKAEKDAVIPSGASISAAVQLVGREGVIGIWSPAVVDGDPASPSGTTSLVIWASKDGVTYVRVYDRTTELPVLLPLGPAEARFLPIDPLFTAGAKYIKVEVVKQSTPTVGITQTASRTFTVTAYEV